VKRYGKRLLRVVVGRSVDIIKMATSTRAVVEYCYEWKDIKKVFVPEHTMDLIKKAGNVKSQETENQYHFSIDVQNLGRIDLITGNLAVIPAMWYAVHMAGQSNKENDRVA
jgi:hypothetical protein